MYDKRNVIVMFLLIMLSFAIITEVSAASEAEINGTGSNPSMISVDMNHDIAGERFNENSMHSHDDDADDFQSHNDQNSFEKTPANPGDNKSNENFYEHVMDLKPGDEPNDLNKSIEFRPSENMSEGMFGDNPMGDVKPVDLRDGNFTNIANNAELMSDVVSNLIGLNGIAPNFKKDGMNVSPNIKNDQKPMGEKINESAPFIPGDKNSSDMGTFDINKNPKSLKIDKKSNKNLKVVKKSAKKVKSIKKPKKVNKKLPKKSKKERAKL